MTSSRLPSIHIPANPLQFLLFLISFVIFLSPLAFPSLNVQQPGSLLLTSANPVRRIRRFPHPFFNTRRFPSILSGPIPSYSSKSIELPRGSVEKSTEELTKENGGWKVGYFTQRIDHFSFSPETSRNSTFLQKYIYSDGAWGGAAISAPIFVYCGNEGPIQWFLDNAGWIQEIAVEFKALVVGPEHRYYGESMPFGSAEAAYATAESRAFLTTEQALADFALLLLDLKRRLKSEGSPIVLFGGSYGGMLAAWFRLKYPHISVGAIASSAPILQYDNVVPTDGFYRIVSDDFKRESASCFEAIRKSWAEIRSEAGTPAGLQRLSHTFGFCRPLKNADELIAWLEDAYTSLAMVDYPIATEFLMPLPAYPIRELCRRMDAVPQVSSLLARIFVGASLFYNFTGDAKCFDTSADPHGENGWNFQACTEQVMPMSSNPTNSMFEPFDWNLTEYVESCKQEFGVSPRPNWILEHYGGRDIKKTLQHFGSSIVFSNGALDPWSGGGVLENISESIVSLIIPDGAHHLDLRASTPNDPPSVVELRQAEKRFIKAWLREFYEKSSNGNHWTSLLQATNAVAPIQPNHGGGFLVASAIVVALFIVVVFGRHD